MTRKVAPKVKPELSLRAAIRRMEKATGRLARARSRREFRAAMKKIEADLLAQYPALSKDGRPVKQRRRRGCRCPICGIPQINFTFFVNHLLHAHEFDSGIEADLSALGSSSLTCWCGKSFAEKSGWTARVRLQGHLSGIEDIQQHYALGALRKM